MLPLDLHVLGLPLAFILSQDQTLHCKKVFNIYKPLIDLPGLKEIFLILSADTFFQYILERFSSLLILFASKAAAKLNDFIFTIQNFLKLFS